VNDELIQFTQHLAQISAQVIKKHFRSGYEVELKEDETPVTVADRQAEEVIRAAIMEAYPEHGIRGEEFPDHQIGAVYQWVLDPIDGTKNFVSGSYLFGTLIALLKDGKPIVGAINQPILDDFLVGNGKQAWLNGRPVQVKPCHQLADAILLTTEHWSTFEHQNGPAFEALSKKVKRYNTWGDCHGYYLVATGGADIMTDPILNEWDLMALIPIIEGAGGVITDWQGNPVIGGNGAVATAGPLHEKVIRRLNP